jgi:hypothetical protein
LERLNKALGLAKGTPLSLRMAVGRPRSLKRRSKGACHIVERGRDKGRIRQAQAATPAASRHAANASARKSRCVRAVVR